MVDEKDPFADLGGADKNDPFADLGGSDNAVKKKEQPSAGEVSTSASQQPLEQPTEQQPKSGKDLEYTWSSGIESKLSQPSYAEQQKSMVEPLSPLGALATT